MHVVNETHKTPTPGEINVGVCNYDCVGAILEGKCVSKCPTLFRPVDSQCPYVTCHYDVKWVLMFSGAAFLAMLLIGLVLGLPIGFKINRRRIRRYKNSNEPVQIKPTKEVTFSDPPILDKKPLDPIDYDDEEMDLVLPDHRFDNRRYVGSYGTSPHRTRRTRLISQGEEEMELEPLVSLNGTPSPPTPASISRSPTLAPPRYSRSTNTSLSPHQAHIHDIIQRYCADFHYIQNSVAWNFTSPDKVGRTNYVHDNFAIGLFTCDGGFLQLPNLGASMYIPPGAIPEGEEREIYMYFSWNNRDLPPLSGSYSPVGPVLLLGDHGQSFMTHIILTCPLSIATPGRDWSLAVMRTDTDTGEQDRWTDVSDSSDTLVIPGVDGTCQMLMNHFTGGHVAAQADPGAVKHMKVGVFGGQLEGDDMAYTFRVHCWNEALTDYVSQKEARFKAWSLDDHERTIDFVNNGRGMVVRITHCAPGWEMNTLKQEISFGHIWSQYYDSVTFSAARTTEKTLKQFFCTVEILQKDTEDPACYRVLSPNVKVNTESKDGSSSVCKHSKWTSDRVLFDLEDCLQPSPQVAAVLPESLSHQLAVILDPSHPEGCDWTMLAELNGISSECIRWLNCQRISPTQKVLDILVAKHTSAAMSVLREYLHQMGHHQALSVIDSFQFKDPEIQAKKKPKLTATSKEYDNFACSSINEIEHLSLSKRAGTMPAKLHDTNLHIETQGATESGESVGESDDTRGSYSSESGYGSPISTMPKLTVTAEINHHKNPQSRQLTGL